MTKKYKNKYRNESTRAHWWDYGSKTSYFVTICTKNRECYFGDIIDGEMHLSETGKIARKYWMEIPDHFPFVILDEFVVMPNHIHGIIIFDKPDGGGDNGCHADRMVVGMPKSGIPTGCASLIFI